RPARLLNSLRGIPLQGLAARAYSKEMKYQLLPPTSVTARPTALPSAQVSRFHWTVVFLQNLPVMSDVEVEDASVVRFFSSSSWLTARPTAELGRSTIAVTPSWSTHFRAMRPPMSG